MACSLRYSTAPSNPKSGPPIFNSPRQPNSTFLENSFMPTYDEIKHIIDPGSSAQRNEPSTPAPRGAPRNPHRNKYMKQVMARFGYSADYYDTLLRRQNGRCAICDQLPKPGTHLHVDHDHKHGPIRGLLCKGCNIALGELEDDPARAEAAAAYLRRKAYD
jgi:hypothetical protein